MVERCVRPAIALLVLAVYARPLSAAEHMWTNIDVSPQLTHAQRVGWSKDGAEFGYCVQTEWETRCIAITVDGKTRKESDCTPGSDETCVGGPESQKVVAHGRARGYSVRRNTGPAGGPLLWQVTGNTFRLVAEDGTGQPSTEVLRVMLPNGAFAAHPDAIALSPDGKSIGVAIHYLIPTDRDDRFELRLVKTSEVSAGH
jgi:hypothetical protein